MMQNVTRGPSWVSSDRFGFLLFIVLVLYGPRKGARENSHASMLDQDKLVNGLKSHLTIQLSSVDGFLIEESSG